MEFKRRTNGAPSGTCSSAKLQQQKVQRQTNFSLHSDKMRSQTKSRRQDLLLKLLVVPLFTVVFAMVSVAFHDDSHEHHDINHLDMLSARTPKKNSNIHTTTTNSTPQQDTVADLPKWITDYVAWHKEVRAQYPGDQLFFNKTAPKLLVRTCLGLCGGLHDRLGQLPWDLYLAMRLKRVLLIAWQRPRELEHFLEPPIDDNNPLAIDWRVPECDIEKRGCYPWGFDGFKEIRAKVLELFDHNEKNEVIESHPDEDFWNSAFEEAMVRAGADHSPGAPKRDPKNAKNVFSRKASYAGNRFLRHRLLGHLDESVLEERLEREGYYKNEPYWKASDLHATPTFGRIWNLFFRPSPAVRAEIVNSLQTMKLLPSTTTTYDPISLLPTPVPFAAVHCRVRHPKAHPRGALVKGKVASYPADKTGLPWEEGGPQRQFALETATKAITCANEIGSNTNQQKPIYFLSDSNDLVQHVAEDLRDEKYLKAHGTNTSWVYPPLLDAVRGGVASGGSSSSSSVVVARNVTLENAHIDRQKGRDPPDYYATFVDLYLAKMAECVVYGIGYYAAFAAKLSGTPCAYLYAKETWGSQPEKNAKICPNT